MRSSTLAPDSGSASGSIFTLGLLPDDRLQLLLIRVVEGFRLPLGRERVEDLQGHLLLSCADRRALRGDPVHVRLRNDLVGIVQRGERSPLP